MTYCIVTSSKEFKDLESKATVNSDVLAAKIALWQQQNNTDRFPTLKELGVEERVSVKLGVAEIFESNPELATIGTLELYSQYLDTIFPNSKEKDIFYHGLPFIENKDDFFRDSEDDGSVGRDNEVNIRLWNYFFKNRDRARDYGDQQYAVILNFSADFDSKELAYKANPTFLTNDSAIVIAQGGDEYVVKSKKQIHILGSKQDIEGFKKFAQGKSRKASLSKPEYRKDVTKSLESLNVNYPDEVVHYKNNEEVFLNTIPKWYDLKNNSLALIATAKNLNIDTSNFEQLYNKHRNHYKAFKAYLKLEGISDENYYYKKEDGESYFINKYGEEQKVIGEDLEGFIVLNEPFISKAAQEKVKDFVDKREINFQSMNTYNDWKNALLTLQTNIKNKLSKPLEYKKGDFTKAEKYLREKLGMSANEIVRVQGLVDGNAFGKILKDGKILLSESFEEGTEYHEAFHRVWNFYLTPEERSRLLDQFKSDPDYKSKIQYLTKSYPDLTEDDLIEEYFAEDFRDYNLAKPKPSNIFEKIYQDIINFFDKLLKASPKDIKELYKLIDEGRYSKAKKLVENTSVEKNRAISINSRELTATEKHELLFAMDYYFAKILFTPSVIKNFTKEFNGEFVNGIFDIAESNYTSDQIKNVYDVVINQVLDDLEISNKIESNEILEAFNEDPDNAFVSLIKEHLSRLSSFNIKTLEEKTSDIITKPDKLSTETDNLTEDRTAEDLKEEGDKIGRSNLDIIPAIEFNTKDSMPKAIKLLISALPDRNKDYSLKRSNVLNIVQAGSWNNNVNILKNSLATLPADINIFIDKIKELSEKYPQFNDLLDYLNDINVDDIIDNNQPITDDVKTILDLRRSFVSEFALTKYNFYTGLLKNGNMVFIPANKENYISTLLNEAKVKFKKNYSEFTGFKLKGDKDANFLAMLKDPNVSLEEKFEVLGLGSLSDVSEEGLNIIKDEVSKILNLVKVDKVSKIYDGEYSVRLNKIINVIAESKSENTELQFMNIDGKPVYLINLNTYQTIIADTINYYIDLVNNDDSIDPIEKRDYRIEYLKEALPHIFKNNQSENSRWIQKIYNGEKVEYAIVEGLKDVTLDKATHVSDLKEGDLFSLNLNMTLSGLSPSQKHSDRSLFPVYKIGTNSSILTPETNINNVVSQAKDVITGYLIDELNKPKGDYSYMDRTLKDEKTYKVKSFFSEIIPYNDFKDLVKGTLQPTDKYIADKITNYLKQSVISEDIKMFKEYGLNKTYKKVEGFGEYAETIYEQTAIGISEEIISKSLFNNDWELAVSYAALESFLQKYEQSILFVGDVTAYKESKDLPKRLNTQSSTGKLSLIGKEIDYQVRKLNSESPVKIGDTTYTYKKDYDVNIIRELVISDPAVKSYYYDNIKQAIKDKLLKDFKGDEQKAEQYATSYAKAYQEYTENDGFSYINMFMAREFELRTDEWNDAKQRNFDLQVKFINSGYDLDSIKDDLNIPDDVKDIGEWLFKTYAPLTIKKPQYVGPNDFTTTDEVGLNVIAGRKTAYLPLMPTAIYDVALNAVHEFMIANSIDVLHMEGAAKFGIKQMRPLYTEGNWDLQEITEDQIGRLPWKYMKNQVKINNIPKNKITSSTQARKNILEGFFDKGVPSDFPGTKEEWDSLSEEQKESASPVYSLVRKYEKVQNTIINRSIDNLLEELDAQVYPDEIKISVKKLRDVLVEAAKDRNSADNVIEAAEKFLEDVKYVELIPNSNKIEPILNALVTNRVLVQKRLGDMVPQAAVTGFESGPRQYDEDGTLKSDSDVLKFYEINKDGSISPAEIIIPVTPEILKAAFTKYNTRNILEAVQKLNSDIAKGDLEVIAKGLRIPNQQFSSNDVFKIKKFLLPMMQGMAVVPSELVAKTGGDFDIDKISLYYYHLDKDGNRIKYYETHTDELFDKFLEDKGVFKKQGDIKTDPNYKSFASRLDNLEAALNALGQEAINEFIKYANETTGKEATTSKEAKSNLREQQQNNQNTIDEIQKTLDASGRKTRKQAVEEGVFLENFDNLVAQQKSLIGQNKLIQRQINDFYAPTQEEKDLEAKRKSAIKAIRTRKKNIKEAFREEFEATPVEEINSQKALENHFLDIEIQMLLHPSQAKNLYSPVADTPLASSKSTYVPKEGIPMTRLFTEAFNVKASIRFVSGKAGVGQLATWINLADLAQRYGVKLNPEYPAVQINIEGFTSNLDLGNNLDEVGESVSIVLSALLTSQVDLVKDPYAEILNIVNQTLDTISYMVLRGISIENIIHIMKHPYISEFLKEERINQSMIIKSTGSFKKGGFVKSNADLKNQFGVLDYEPSIITIDQIKSKDKSISKDVLALFLNLREQAKEVNKVKRYYSPDTKYLKDRNGVIALNDLYQEINDVPFPIITLDEQRKLISNDSIIEPFFKGRELYNDLYERFYFVDKLKVYQAFKTTLPKLLYLTTTDKEKFYNKLDQHLITYFIQNFYSVIENYSFDEIMKGKNSLAKGLFDLKDNPKFKDNLFLQNIFVLLENGSAKLDNFRSFKGKGTTSFINEQADSFEELPLEIQNLIEIGNIFQSGTYNSVFQLNKFLPYTSQSKIVSDINDVIDAILTDSDFRSEIINEFAHKFLLANTEYLPEDWKFNPKYNYSNITSFFPYAIDNNNKVHLVIDGSLTSQIVTPIGNYQGVDYRKQVPITDNFVELASAYVEKASVNEDTGLLVSPVKKIIAGGQTGIDQLGLMVGKALKLETGGIAPKGYKTEKGLQPSLKEEYGLEESISSDYSVRTKLNVQNSNGTVLFGDITSTGSKLTLKLLSESGKPFIVNPTAIELKNWTIENNIKVLNVAGNRASKLTEKQLEVYKNVLIDGLSNQLVKTEEESDIFVPTEGLKKINPYATKPGAKPEVQDGTDKINIDNFDSFFPQFADISIDEKIQMLRAMSQEEIDKICKIG